MGMDEGFHLGNRAERKEKNPRTDNNPVKEMRNSNHSVEETLKFVCLADIKGGGEVG